MLRSASPWSTGLRRKETSIQNAYIESISKAKRFIYIENQFFLSSTKRNEKNKKGVKNSITKALFYRIKNAILKNEEFKVIVFMPLLPAFEGDLSKGKNEGVIMQAQLGFANGTIGVGHHSLYSRLSKITPNPQNYIIFCSLRRFEETPTSAFNGDGKTAPPPAYQTNLIYIHSKVGLAESAHDHRRREAHHGQREPQRPQHARLP
jgi:phospholipase D1/2